MKSPHRESKPPRNGWTDEYHREATKELLRLASTDARSERLRSVIADILLDPYRNAKKKGRLKDCRAARVALTGVQYRIVYEIDEIRHVVRFWCVAPRERVYDIVKRRLR